MYRIYQRFCMLATVDREAHKRRATDFSPEIAARKYLDLLGLS